MRTQRLVSWIAGLFSLVAVSAPSGAEIVKRVSVEGIYDNNAFKSSDGVSDAITQTSFYLARRDTSAKAGVEYFYAGDLALFAQSGQRHFTTHHVGVAYIHQLGPSRHLFSAGFNFGGRWDRALYDYYNNLDGALYANLKLNLPGATFLRMNYWVNARKYIHLDASSFREHLVSLTYSASLPSRTALRADVSYGYKGYTMERLTTALVSVPQPAGRMGMGMRRGPGGGPQFRGEAALQEVVVQSDAPGKSQIALSLRLSQSLSPSTGLNIQYLRRLNPSIGGFYQSGLGTGYAEDDDLFDDRYDYEGHEISGGVSQLLPWGSKLTVEAGYFVKGYRNRPALDLNGLSLGQDRDDRKRSLSAGVDMPLGMSMDLNLWYIYGTNASNDLFYSYRGNHAFSVGVSREF